MRPYLQVFSNSLAVSLAFRWGLLTGVITRLLQVLGTIFVWRAILPAEGNSESYTADGMTQYFVAIALVSILFSPGHFFRLYSLVIDGTLSSYLVRPYSFLGDSFATFAGSRVVELAVIAVLYATFSIVGIAVFSPIGLFELALVASNLLLFFLFGSLIGTLSFWLLEMWPVQPLYAALMALAGGALFPLDALPPTLYEVLQYTPFSLFGFVTARALQGDLSSDAMLRFATASLLWSVLCFCGYCWLWHRGLKRFEAVNA